MARRRLGQCVSGICAPSVRSFRHSVEGDAAVYSTARGTGILLALAGMALQWGFLHSITFLGSILGNQAEYGPDGAWTVNSIVTFAVFLILFASAGKASPLIERRKSVPFVTACLVVGLAFLVLGNVVLSSAACNYVGNVAVALGTTPMIVMWGEVYRYLNPKGEQLLVTLSAAPLAVALYLVTTLLPFSIAMTAFASMPIASVYCLVRSYGMLKGSSGSWRARAGSVSGKSPALFFACIAVFSIPYNYLRSTSDLQYVFGSSADWSSVLAMTIFVLVLAALAEAVAERFGGLLVPGFVLSLLSIAMIASLLQGLSSITVPYCLYSGYYLFLAMVYLALGPIVAITDRNPTRLFSGAMLANVAGLLLGSAMSGLERWMGVENTTITVLVVTYVLFIMGFALLNGRSYSLFRVNSFDEELYSFEYAVPTEPASDPTAFGGSGQVSSMVDAIVQQCETAGERYGLSAREEEVLVELVRGRTIASVAEQLVVSENTVKAHTKGIYRKLGVHTREELLQRVEGVSD